MKGTKIGRTTPRVLLILATLVLAALLVAGCGAESAPTPQVPEPDQPGATQPTGTTRAAALAYETVDVEQAHEQLSTNEDAQIVDVREPAEWTATGVPPGAVLIPLGQLEQRASAELDKDRPVYVLCNSGNRSRTGSEILLRLGFTEVYNVAGGIQDWLRSGLPVEAYRP